MPYTLRQASDAVRKERTTLLRAIQAGKLSAARDAVTGAWLIEAAELHRVYPPSEHTGADKPDAELRTSPSHADTQAEIRELRAKLEAAEGGNRLRDEVITDLRAQRDRESAERRQAQDRLAAAQERIAALLTDQRAAAPARRSWWRWRRA